MRISEVARQTGLRPGTIRFYEQAGVIAPATRDASGYRAYTDRDVQAIRCVACLRSLGIALPEAGKLAALCRNGDCAPMVDRLDELIDRRFDELAETQRRIDRARLGLQAVRRALREGPDAAVMPELCLGGKEEHHGSDSDVPLHP